MAVFRVYLESSPGIWRSYPNLVVGYGFFKSEFIRFRGLEMNLSIELDAQLLLHVIFTFKKIKTVSWNVSYKNMDNIH